MRCGRSRVIVSTGVILRLPHNAIEVPDKMPYQAIITRLRAQIAREKDQQKREDLEARIIVLIGIMELKRSVDRIVEQLKNISE